MASPQRSNLVLVLELGFGLGVATTFFFNITPNLLEQKVSWLNQQCFKGSYFISILIAISALLTYPISLWV